MTSLRAGITFYLRLYSQFLAMEYELNKCLLSTGIIKLIHSVFSILSKNYLIINLLVAIIVNSLRIKPLCFSSLSSLRLSIILKIHRRGTERREVQASGGRKKYIEGRGFGFKVSHIPVITAFFSGNTVQYNSKDRIKYLEKYSQKTLNRVT